MNFLFPQETLKPTLNKLDKKIQEEVEVVLKLLEGEFGLRKEELEKTASNAIPY